MLALVTLVPASLAAASLQPPSEEGPAPAAATEPAALAADRDVDGKDSGEKGGPRETARPRRRVGRLPGGVRGAGEVERERKLQLGRRDGGGRNDVGAQVMVTR